MDGVPYVTQQPVETGGSHTYEFTLPDSGLFPFHSHCNTVEQLGRGLAGALLVTGDETRPYDDDVLCIIKDWRLGEDGKFLDFENRQRRKPWRYLCHRSYNKPAKGSCNGSPCGW